MSKSVILASTSPYRKELMQRLTVPFEAFPPQADEEALKSAFLKKHPKVTLATAKQLAADLSLHKAMSLATKGDIIIGSDQICFFEDDGEGKIIGKPGNMDKTSDTLHMLSGHTHHLLTAVTAFSESKAITWVHESRIRFRNLNVNDILSYLALDEPFDCAGGYKLESAGISLVDSVESDDWTAIQGLPIISLGKCLRELGVDM